MGHVYSLGPVNGQNSLFNPFAPKDAKTRPEDMVLVCCLYLKKGCLKIKIIFRFGIYTKFPFLKVYLFYIFAQSTS